MRLGQGLLAADLRSEFSDRGRDRRFTDVPSAGSETTPRVEYRITGARARRARMLAQINSKPVERPRLDFLPGR